MSRLRRLVDTPVKLWLTLTTTLLLGLILHESLIGHWDVIGAAARDGALARQSSGALRDFRIAIVHCLLVGYLAAALFAVVRGGRRTVFELQSALDCTDEECAALAGSIRFSRGWLVTAASVGLAFGIITPYLVPPVPENLWHPSSWSPEVSWHRVLGPIASVLSFVLAYAILSVSGRMSRLAGRLGSIDLFDHRPLMPFTQQGLTNALLLIGLFSIYGLMLLTETGFGLVALIIGLTTLTGAALTVVLPLRGVHRRIAQAKAEELSWLDADLGKRRSSIRDGGGGAEPGKFADLAAHRREVSDVSEWPVNTSTYVRFALYSLIPVASWAAAALVERFVDALF